MNKVIRASTCAVIIVLASLSTVASARTVDRNDLIQRFDRLFGNWSEYGTIGPFFNVLLGFLAGIGFVTSIIILYFGFIVLRVILNS